MQILAAIKWDDAKLAHLGEGTIGTGARILGVVLEYFALVSQGTSKNAALQALRARTTRYGAKVLEKLEACPSLSDVGEEFRELPLRDVMPGMTILQEIRTQQGMMLVPKGFEVTKSFLDRISQLAPELLSELVRIRAPGSAAAAP
jgi:hypothetical protein